MTPIKLSIRDNSFGHAPISNTPTPPIVDMSTVPIQWDRESPATIETIYTDARIPLSPTGERIWLIEPCHENNRALFEQVLHHGNKYSEIWTADREILEANEHAKFVPNAGCWIKPDDRSIWKKCKGISTIASNKRGGVGYDLRHKIIASFPFIDAYGSDYRPILPTWNDKIWALRDYRFHVVVENCRRDFFYTEKLIDCFATGTVPIYWGCPSVGKFFDTRGMFCFEDLNGLNEILLKIFGHEKEIYESRSESICENFMRARDLEFGLTEDWIFRRVLKL